MDEKFFDIFNRKGDLPEEVISETETTTEEIAEAETETVETPETPEVEATAEAPVTEPTAEQPRDDRGQFAEKRITVPITALHAERDKARAEAQRATELEQRLREYEAQQRQANRPDPFENPEDYDRYLQEQVDLRLEQKLREHEAQRQRQFEAQQAEELFKPFQASMAQHGPEKTQEALEYASTYAVKDDAWGQAMLRSTDPVATILEEKNRHAQAEAEWAEYQRDPQAFKARIAAELSAAGAVTAPANQPQMAATAKAPRSLASAGGGTPATPTVQSPSEAFLAIFKNR